MFITHKFIKIHSIKLEVFYFFYKFFIVFKIILNEQTLIKNLQLRKLKLIIRTDFHVLLKSKSHIQS